MNNAKTLHKPSLLQLVLSLLAALLLVSGSGLLLSMGILQLLETGINSPYATQSFMLAAGLLLGGGLMLPSAWHAWRRLRPHAPASETAPELAELPEAASQTLPRTEDGGAAGSAAHPARILISKQRLRRTTGLILLTLGLVAGVPLALLAGDWITRENILPWLLLPGLNLLVIGLPILWLVMTGKRGLAAGSAQRQWGIFASGLALGPLIILGIELLALLVLSMVGLIVMLRDPGLMREFSFLITRMTHAQPDQEVLLRILTPMLEQPAILAGIFGFAAVLVPLIEEALKPFGLWLMAGRRLTPAEGFVGGLISGAGFALFENLFSTSAGGETWALLASSRITTAMLHVLASGLVGWGLAHAWGRGRYFRLAFAYALAVTLHGVWNSLGIASFILPYLDSPALQTLNLENLNGLIVIGLGMLTFFNFILYLGFNRGLRRSARTSIPLPAADALIAPGAEAETPLANDPSLNKE